MRFAISHNDANIYAYQYVHDPTTSGVDKDPILGIRGPLGDQYLYAHTQFDVQGSYRVYKGLASNRLGSESQQRSVWLLYRQQHLSESARILQADRYLWSSVVFGGRFLEILRRTRSYVWQR